MSIKRGIKSGGLIQVHNGYYLGNQGHGLGLIISKPTHKGMLKVFWLDIQAMDNLTEDDIKAMKIKFL